MSMIVFFIRHKYRYIAHKKAQERLFLNIMVIKITFGEFICVYGIFGWHNRIEFC